ncbi:Retinol dehydrogenase 5 [Podila humilis]|nr:Retinol dehydrogenase 5 [Podila humilis]
MTVATYNLTNTDYLVVVITGCDTGFGAEITEDLYQRGGFTIFATCLTDDAVAAYNARDSTRLRSLKVDVTKQEDVDALQRQIEAECPQGVYCLLNNAGVFAGGFFDFASIQSFELLMAVNYTGLIRISKAILPSLRTFAKSRHMSSNNNKLPRARLLNITSIAGRLNSPSLSGYCASKHAAESLLDTLRIELAPWEIDVSMIEPWFAKTPIVANSTNVINQSWLASDESIRQMYGDPFMDTLSARSQLMYSKAMPSKWVVDAVVHAIRQKRGAQRARIVVGFWWVSILLKLQELTPDWILDRVSRVVLRHIGSWPSDPFLTAKTKDQKRD